MAKEYTPGAEESERQDYEAGEGLLWQGSCWAGVLGCERDPEVIGVCLALSSTPRGAFFGRGGLSGNVIFSGQELSW